MKKGWLKKQNRSGGLFKNWKSRFIVMDEGRIYYYEKELPDFPYGEILKGTMDLNQSQFVETKDVRKIWINSEVEGDLILEAANGPNAQEWRLAIRLHIDYANSERMSSPSTYARASAPIAEKSRLSSFASAANRALSQRIPPRTRNSENLYRIAPSESERSRESDQTFESPCEGQ
jgi:hypothetical protein